MKITKEEKTVLITIAIALIAGLAINFLFSYQNKLQVKSSNEARLLINLNTATAADFDRLPGVGKVIGGRIIKYREKNGPFTSVEGIKMVKGITNKKFEIIKKYIIVTEE